MPRPDLTRVAEYFARYINQVEEDDLMKAMKKQSRSFAKFLDEIPKNKRDYKYAEDKWTIKEVLQHIIDAERVFAYRALCFARKDTAPLPGFDENDFAANAKTENRKWKDLVKEFKIVRQSSEILFGDFDEEQLNAAGTASGNPNYVLGIGFILVGHVNHHVTILKERYLAKAAKKTKA